MNLLQVVRAAAGELGLTVPSSALNNADLIVSQLVALTRAAGSELVARRVWRNLVREHTFTTTTEDRYALPDDYGRPISDTTWDTVNHWPIDGPLLTAEWQYLQSGIVSSGPRMQFRMVRNCVEVRPQPVTAGVDVSFYYISSSWIYQDGAAPTDDYTYLADFEDDTDKIVFPDRLIVNAVKLKFVQAKGLDDTRIANDFQNCLDDAIAGDTGGQTLNLASGVARFPLVGVWNIPDGSWDV
jgi:hypothetical protein